MRIDAVRGENLASLRSFELALNRPPLSEAGIFAITGPTGAGKSTLLDAICLALYDRVPRLRAGRDVDSGEAGVSAVDPRALIRRGAEQAWAEVDFTGHGGARYRAHWEAHRARRRVEGRLQKQRLSLMSLPELRDLSGATKTVTLAEIQARVGLSFAEFQRAVLLPQGEFTAFLDARPEERAALLERMTGSEIYGRLSQQAFARAKAAREALEAEEAELSALPVISPGELAYMQAELHTCEARQAEAQGAARAARAALSWHRERQRRQLEVSQAASALTEAEAALQAEAEAAAALAEAERAAPLASVVDWAERARAQAASAAQASAEASSALAEVSAVAEQASARLGEAEASAAALARAAEATTDERRQAARLERAIEDAARELQEAARQQQARAEAQAETAASLEALGAQAREAQAQGEGLRAQIEARGALAGLGEASSWRGQLRDYAELSAAQRDRSAAQTRAQAALEEARAAQASASSAVARAKQARDEAADRWRGAEAALARSQEAQADLHDVRVLVAEERGKLSGAKRELAQAREHLATLNRDAATAASVSAAFKEASATRKLAQVELKRLDCSLEPLVDQLETQAAFQLMSERRHELLEPQAPCPLCGSTAHAPDQAQPADPARLSRLRGLRTRRRRQRERVRDRLQVAQQAEAEARMERQQLQERGKKLKQELAAFEKTWAALLVRMQQLWTLSDVLAQEGAHRLGLLLPERGTAASAGAALQETEAELRALSERLQHRQDGLQDMARQRDQAAAALERARAAWDQAQEQLAAAEAAMVQRQRALSELEVAVELDEARARELWAQLRGPLAAISEAGARRIDDAAPLIAALEAGLAELRAAEAARAALSEQVAETQSKLQITHGVHEERAAAQTRAAQALAAAQATHQAQQRARAPLLGGLSLEDFDARQAALAQVAAEALGEAQAASGRAAQAKSLAEDRARGAAERQAQSELQAAEAEAKLAAEAAAAGWASVASLRAALDHPKGWALALGARLLELREAHTRAAAQHEDRRARLQAQEADPERHHGAQADAEAALERAEAEERGYAKAGLQLLHRMEVGAAALRQAARRRPRAQAARVAAEEWAELSEVIGSADGKKLRAFAQGLSLGLLLEQANRHLAQLRPRYRLARVPGTDLELRVIDRDLGETPRPLSSLSGGERFLTALSLALALSSLSSQDLHIESLFIDEGFGSLDREALEVALSTLDQLQAEGRSIGLISHVPELADRIGYRAELRRVGPGVSELVIPELL